MEQQCCSKRRNSVYIETGVFTPVGSEKSVFYSVLMMSSGRFWVLLLRKSVDQLRGIKKRREMALCLENMASSTVRSEDLEETHPKIPSIKYRVEGNEMFFMLKMKLIKGSGFKF